MAGGTSYGLRVESKLIAMLVSCVALSWTAGCSDGPTPDDAAASADASAHDAGVFDTGPAPDTSSDVVDASAADAPPQADAGSLPTGDNRLTINGTEYILDGPNGGAFTRMGASITSFGYVGRTADSSVGTSFGLVLQTAALPPMGPVTCSATRPPAVGGGSNNLTFGGMSYRWAPDASTCTFTVTHASATAGERFAGTYSGTLVATDGTTIEVTDGAFDVVLTGP